MITPSQTWIRACLKARRPTRQRGSPTRTVSAEILTSRLYIPSALRLVSRPGLAITNIHSASSVPPKPVTFPGNQVRCFRKRGPESVGRNRTLSILNHTKKIGYGVLAMTCYDAQSAIAFVRAAERSYSPAIIQLLPVTLRYGKGPYLQFFLNLAHNASVPIAVHLDHGVDPSDLGFALNLGEKGPTFDSIMIDPPRVQNEEVNVKVARDYIKRAHQVGVAVELEMGRARGHSLGLHESEGQITDPAAAELYVKRTGANILAPNIGNAHGPYDHPIELRQDITRQLKDKLTSIPLALHGATGLPAEILADCIRSGFTNVNVNRFTRQLYVNALTTGMQDKALSDAIEFATETLAQECEEYFKLFGSAGKA